MSSIVVAPDIENYKFDFVFSKNRHSPYFGFVAINHFFYNLNLSFYQFYMLYHGICIILVFLSIQLIFNKSLTCIFFYLAYPFLLNVTQIKNFAMMALMLLGFSLCYRCKSYKNEIILWISLIFLAGSQHVAGFAYLPFIFVKGKIKYLEKLPIIMFVITSLFILASGDILTIILRPLLLLTMDESYKVTKFATKGTSLGAYIYIIQSILMIYIAKKTMILETFYRKNCVNKVFYTDSNKCFTQYVYEFVLFSTLFWPLFVSSTLYSRLIENQMILIYIAIIFLFSSYNQLKTCVNEFFLKDFYFKILSIFGILMFFNLYTLWISHWEDVVVEIMNNLKPFYVFTTNS